MNDCHFSHIKKMTSRLQIVVYLSLLRTNKKSFPVDDELLNTLSMSTGYSIPIVRDVIYNLLLDNHLLQKDNTITLLP